MAEMNLIPFAVIWGVLALIVVALIAYRRTVASQEDDTLHVLQSDVISQQSAVAQKLETIDKWGKVLTVLAVLYGLVVAAGFVYQTFVNNTRMLQ